jgi:hypothetical protein
MARMPPGSFGPPEVYRAISKAGVPMILLLNPEWVQHVAFHSVNVCGMVWRFAPTKAERVELSEPLLSATFTSRGLSCMK